MLQLFDVRKRFGTTPVLNGVTFGVARGEVVVLMGPSGCGKTTVLRCINRLVEPDSGEIWFDGDSVLQMAHGDLLALRRRIGVVFQGFNLIGRLSVLDNVTLALALSGVPRPEAEQRARAALKRVGMAQFEKRKPADLSGGQRQRVSIARALAQESELMLWDEPTANLDPHRAAEVMEVMEEVLADTRAGMLVVTHEIPFALRVADRLLLMQDGRIVEEGKPQEVLESPQSELGAHYRQVFHTRYGGEIGRRTSLGGEAR